MVSGLVDGLIGIWVGRYVRGLVGIRGLVGGWVGIWVGRYVGGKILGLVGGLVGS